MLRAGRRIALKLRALYKSEPTMLWTLVVVVLSRSELKSGVIAYCCWPGCGIVKDATRYGEY